MNEENKNRKLFKRLEVKCFQLLCVSVIITIGLCVVAFYNIKFINKVYKQEKKIEALEEEWLMLYSKLEELDAKIYIEVE